MPTKSCSKPILSYPTTPRRSRQAKSQEEGIMHFASQTAADAYVLQRQIDKLAGRTTRSRTAILAPFREKLTALGAPVYKLSDDLLSMVFELGMDNCEDTSFAECVSHVTSRWRRTALATPKIWSSIRVRLDSSLPGRMEFLKTLVERAGTCPLDLSLVGYTSFNELQAEQLQEIYGFLRTLLPFCVSLQLLNESTHLLLSRVFFLPGSLFNNLHMSRLRILILNRVLVIDYRTFTSFLESCSSLRALYLINASAWQPPSVILASGPVTIPTLQTLTVVSDESSPLLQLLKFPSIRDLEVRSMLLGLKEIPQSGLDSLRSLRFSDVRFTNCDGILSLMFYSPALKEIAFIGTDLGGEISLIHRAPNGWMAGEGCELEVKFCTCVRGFLRSIQRVRDNVNSQKVNRVRVCDELPLSIELQAQLKSWISDIEWSVCNRYRDEGGVMLPTHEEGLMLPTGKERRSECW